MYQQYLEVGGHSGKHRHMTEELLYVIEGEGYDLHWDPQFHCDVEIEWSWAEEPKRFDWKPGDFVYIPAWAIHQHFQRGDGPARFISATSRQVGQIGFDWLDQLETVEAPPIPI
jgi:gentisate 1,2-dioxygenase